MTVRGALVLTLVALIAALSWWLQGRVKTPAGLLGTQGPEQPDYYMDGYRILVTDDQGRPQYRMHGERMAHLPSDDTGELTAPELTLYTPDAPPWTVKAASGWVSPGAKEVDLRGGVQITRLAQAGQSAIRIDTETLAVRPQERTARTEDPVVAVAPEGRLTAVGMVADLDARRIEFLSQARGEYVAR